MGVTRWGARVVDIAAPDAPTAFSDSLHDTGFALLKGHDVPTSLVEQITAEWGAFFSSGLATDFLAVDGSPWGYHRPPGGLTADGVSHRDRKEYYHLSLDGPLPPGISGASLDMFGRAAGLAVRLLGWLEAVSTGGALSRLSTPLSDSVSVSRSVLRAQRYLPFDVAPPPGSIRSLAHADINLLTLLPAPAASGLQLRRRAGDEQWVDLPYDPGIIIVNVGEMLDLASAGYYPATPHRVVVHKPEHAMRPRWSVPMFFHPHDDVELAPGVTAGEYRDKLVEGYRQKGWTVNTGTGAFSTRSPAVVGKGLATSNDSPSGEAKARENPGSSTETTRPERRWGGAAGSFPSYDHRSIETRWAAEWERAGLFRADPASTRPRYSIAQLPPSVSAKLHMGHALQTIVQDILARCHRMRGYEVLWLPGIDHAGIATQRAIESELATDGQTKEDLGREGFAERVAQRNEQYMGAIAAQLRQLGASLDFGRLRFTMDRSYEGAVRTAFVKLWERGLIYQDLGIVNWCPTCSAVLSDGEVSWQSRPTDMLTMSLNLEGAPSRRLVVQTCRPELLPAAVAVVVDPKRVEGVTSDDRTVLPLIDRVVPVVLDEQACRQAETGAMLLLPGHDRDHWAVGRRHGLETRLGLDDVGRVITWDGHWLNQRPVEEARRLVTTALKACEDAVDGGIRTLSIGLCSRCEERVETIASRQWFLSMDELAARARAVQDGGRLRFHPGRYEGSYTRWLDELHDWCLSRQRWVGPRVPAFTCAGGHRTVAVDIPEECPECRQSGFEQETDVLDTWFSQAIWPFAALGWPDEEAQLMSFYPTSSTVCSRDALALGVSRMVIAGLEFTDRLPFTDAVITSVVGAPDGRKMDTQRGTAMDPGEIVTTLGADALRGWAAMSATIGQDVRFDPGLVTAWRRTIGKLWFAVSVVAVANVVDRPAPTDGPDDHGGSARCVLDRWILSRLHHLVVSVTEGIETVELHRSAQALFRFIGRDLRRRYLVAARPRLDAGDPVTAATAVQVLDVVIRLLHPFLPFVTEELWHQLPGDRPLLECCGWPEAFDLPVDAQAEAEMESARWTPTDWSGGSSCDDR